MINTFKTALPLAVLSFGALLFSCSMNPEADNSAKLRSEANSTYWFEDFESTSLDKWDFLLNGQGIELVSLGKSKDNRVAKVSVTGNSEFLWNNNPALNRSELQHKPLGIEEGTTSLVSWKFMLPKLFTDSRHEFGYWESDKTYQQIMRFNIQADRLSFSDAAGKSYWQYSGLSINTWYELSMQITWSSDPNKGKVSVNFNGETVLEDKAMPTLIKNEKPFLQLGILRNQQDLIETIYLDDVSSGLINN